MRSNKPFLERPFDLNLICDTSQNHDILARMQGWSFISYFQRPLGVDLFCFGKKYLVFNLVARNLKIKYRRSILGILWTLVGPFSMAMVYYLVFNHFLKIKIPHYLSYILSGTLAFSFFSQSLSEGTESIVGNWGLSSKVPMPLQVFPYAGTLTNLITLLLSLPILLLAAWISKVSLGPSLFCLPFYFLAFFLITYGFSFLLGVAFVYFRDLRHLLSIILQVWFYGTPVVYSEAMIPENLKWIIHANPIGDIIVGIHQILAEGSWPSLASVLICGFWVVLLTFGSAFVHKKFISLIVEQI